MVLSLISRKKEFVRLFFDISPAVCAEAFNPDEDEEEKEPLVITVLYRILF